MTRPSPWLLLAVGNPSRGDDALGPALMDRLRDAGIDAAGDVELLVDFQLQVEHALDLLHRRAVLFVDAARPGTVRGATLQAIEPDACVPPASHALRSQAVLYVARALHGDAPPCWQLAIEGERFDLGAGLSDAARCHLDQAHALAIDWLRHQRATCGAERDRA